MSTYREIDHPRDNGGRFATKGKGATPDAVAALRTAAARRHERKAAWSADADGTPIFTGKALRFQSNDFIYCTTCANNLELYENGDEVEAVLHVNRTPDNDPQADEEYSIGPGTPFDPREGTTCNGCDLTWRHNAWSYRSDAALDAHAEDEIF